MRRLLGPEADRLELSLQEPPVTGLRVNTLKLSAAAFERLLSQAVPPQPRSPPSRSTRPPSWSLEAVPWCPAGFVLEFDGSPGRHPFHAAGLYYLQEPSAMAVAEALAPRAGERVLDLAAAPGGKSTHLAALLGDSGLLVANDVHGGRARELSRNLERWGARRALVTSADPRTLADLWSARFDAVLLDAPCSGEGMFRKTPEAIAHWSPQIVKSCVIRQDALLAEAARLVRPGGRLAYSTCTLEPAENEEVIGRFLAERPDWEAIETGLAGVASGRPEWAGGERATELRRAVRIWPHRHAGEGHFLVLLRRGHESPPEPADRTGDTGPVSTRIGRNEGRRNYGQGRSGATAGGSAGKSAGESAGDSAESRQAKELWRGFISDNLTEDPFPDHALIVQRDGLYAVPPGAPDLAGVRVLRPGLWLGSVSRERFAPSHSLALALRREDALRSVILQPGEAGLDAYLLGAELERPGEDGWVLVTVAGFPLGWGRSSRDIIKNHYPKGLRRPVR